MFRSLSECSREAIRIKENLLWKVISRFPPDPDNFASLKTVCIIVGPYRNLSTLLASLLFLHPTCQVLNHAEDRVLSKKELNFLRDYSDEKFSRFCRFALFASARGQRSGYGGSILFSHAFERPAFKQAFRERFGAKTVVKKKVESIVWKANLRASSEMKHSGIDWQKFFEKNRSGNWCASRINQQYSRSTLSKIFSGDESSMPSSNCHQSP